MNKVYLRQPYPNELYHHGIKGQKWGVRRYQNPDGTLTPAGRERYNVGSINRSASSDATKSLASKGMSKGDIDPEVASIAAVTTLAVVAPLIPVVARSVKASKAKKFKKQCDKERAMAKTDPKTGLKLIPPPPKTTDENLKRVNPNYSISNDEKWHSNCVNCSLAFELRRRGYEVQAKPNPLGEDTEKYLPKTFKNPKRKVVGKEHPVTTVLNRHNMTEEDIDKLDMDELSRISSEMYEEWEKVYAHNGKGKKNLIAEFHSAMAKEPAGSRGQLGLAWGPFGGHSICYEINGKGECIIYDPQSGEKYTGKKVDKLLKHAELIDYTRLDNLEINPEVCKKEVV